MFCDICMVLVVSVVKNRMSVELRINRASTSREAIFLMVRDPPDIIVKNIFLITR